jgi:NAD(P)-dependent dehydrogenase (short-subunit alcohol dehydrogenase family)
VNTVLPGLVDTPLSSKIVQNEAALKASEKMHALGRIGKSSEVAAAIQWLFSNESSWVTGQEIAIDGGLSSVHSSIR